MLTPAELFALNHPLDGEHGRLKRGAVLQDVYDISLRQWRRICAGECEINRSLAHALLDRFAALYPHSPLTPCVVQVLPDGDWLIRVRQEDTPHIARLLNTNLLQKAA